MNSIVRRRVRSKVPQASSRPNRASRCIGERITRNFTSIDDVLLTARVFGWAVVLPILKHIVPVRSLARAMRLPAMVSQRDSDRERRIITFTRWATRLVRWTSGGNCLERGLIAFRYLSQAGASPTLVVAVGRPGGSFAGHAWVVVDGSAVGERESALAAYAPVFVFASDGSMLDAGGQPIPAAPLS